MNIIESQWEKAQKQIFLEWINETLPEHQINDLAKDLQDGIVLIRLVEKLKERKCSERIVEHPKIRIQKISNCTVALHFIQQSYNIKPLCSAENIVDSERDSKYLLGLLFQLYLKDHKSLLISSQHNQQDQYAILMQWLQQLLQDYGIEIKNQDQLMKNFYNGKILVALLDCFFEQEHTFYDYMMKKGEGERIGISMRMAHDLLGVTELLTTEDVIAHQIDSRVFFFYFDFLMNAFKTKSRIQQIDLVELVEEGLRKLANELNKEQNEMNEEDQQEINLTQDQKKQSSSKKHNTSPLSNSDDSGNDSKSDSENNSENDEKSSSESSSEDEEEIHQSKQKNPIVLKDVLYKGRVTIDQHPRKSLSPKDIFQDPDEERRHSTNSIHSKEKKQKRKEKPHSIQQQIIPTSEVSLYESCEYKPDQSMLIHRKHQDISSHHSHRHKHRKHHHKHHHPSSYSQTTTETTISTSSNGNYIQQHHSQTSETTISYSFWFI